MIAVGCAPFATSAEPSDGGGVPHDAADADADAAVACGEPDAVSRQGHCYFFVPSNTRLRVSESCLSAGAHLVTITDKAEGDFLLTSFRWADDVWCGLQAPPGTNDRAAFQWDTKEPVAYSSWEPNNPNDATGCIAIESTGLWADKGCGNPLRGLCERE